MIDEKLTQQIAAWLTLPDPKSDGQVTDGAQLLLRLNRNRALYNSVVLRPQRHAGKVAYELKKWYSIRTDGMTLDAVNRMDSEITPVVKSAVEAEPKDAQGNIIDSEGLPAISGKRIDHESLPDEIKDIWQKNAERWKKIKQLYNTLLTLQQPYDRYEYLKQMKELWYEYKADFEKYDSYGSQEADGCADTPSVQDAQAAKAVTNARSYISKNLRKLQKMQSGRNCDDMDEKTRKAYASTLAAVQQRVDTITEAGEVIGEELRKELAGVGITFNDKANAEG